MTDNTAEVIMGEVMTRDIIRRLEAIEAWQAKAAERSVGERVWDLMMKGAVPLAIILAGAMVRNEVVDMRQETLIDKHREMLDDQQKRLEQLPPVWLKESINEIKNSQKDMAGQIREIERRIK